MDITGVRSRFFFVFCLFGWMGIVSLVPAQSKSLRQSLSGDLNLRAYYNDVSGNENNSFLTEGPGVLSDVYFYYDNTSRDTSQIQWDGLLYLQGTDDPRFEIRNDKIRIRNVYLTAERKNHWKATGGYFSENFSALTFTSSLFGLNTQYSLTDSLGVKFFGGRASRARSGESHLRYGMGTRLDWTLAPENTLSFNYVRTQDDDDSLNGDELSGVSSDTETNVVRSIEYEGVIGEDLDIRGEFASSNYDSKPTSGASSVDNEVATQLSLRWRPRNRTELRGYYEKVDPDFRTLSGFARTDRKLVRFNWNERFTRALAFLSEYEVWENGLESTTTNDVTNWSVETNYTPRGSDWWNRRVSLFYENRENEGETEGIDFDGTDVNDEDRYRWGIDWSNQFGRTGFDLNYGREHFGGDSETIRTVETTLDRRFELSVPVYYTFNGLYKENEVRGAGPGIDRSVRIENEVFLARGRAQELRFYHWHSNEDAAGAKEIVNHTVGSEFRHTLNRKLGSRLDFSLEWHQHTDRESPDQNYKEESIELRYQTPF